MRNHRSKAEAHVSAVQATTAALREEYAKPVHNRATIADLNTAINRGLKLAEIHAVLAVADAIAQDAPVERAGEYL